VKPDALQSEIHGTMLQQEAYFLQGIMMTFPGMGNAENALNGIRYQISFAIHSESPVA
jgi:hypothetical protein